MVAKETGLPIAEGLESANDLPHTISFAVLYRARIDSFGKLPKDKRPPRGIWDKPYRLNEFLDHIWDKDGKGATNDFVNIDEEDVE